MSDARNQILSTAGALFADRGYELVGINEIIEKSGVAKATFYSHFKSKEKLCLEWLKGDAAETATAHEKLLVDPRPPLEKVAKKFDSLRRYVKGSDFRGCPFSITASMLDASSEVRETIRAHKAANREFWQALAAQVRGDASAESRLLGDTFFLLYSGAVMESQNARSTWPADSAKAAALALCEGLPA